MRAPTTGEKFAELIEHITKAQEAAAMIAHLHGDTDTKSRKLAVGWIAVSEQLKLSKLAIVELAKGGMH